MKSLQATDVYIMLPFPFQKYILRAYLCVLQTHNLRAVCHFYLLCHVLASCIHHLLNCKSWGDGRLNWWLLHAFQWKETVSGLQEVRYLLCAYLSLNRVWFFYSLSLLWFVKYLKKLRKMILVTSKYWAQMLCIWGIRSFQMHSIILLNILFCSSLIFQINITAVNSI